MKYESINFIPPVSVSKVAERALKWRKQYGKGGTEVGVKRAIQLKNRNNLSPTTIKRMISFFARHSINADKHHDLINGEPTAWRIAWDLWGGDEGLFWASKIYIQMNKEDEI